MPSISFNDHFKDLFENTSDLIHFLTLDGNIELVNPAWLKTLDYELHEVVGRSIYEFIHEPCIKEYKEARTIAIANNYGIELVTTLVTKKGEPVIGEGQIGCSYNKDGRGYTRCVFKNITGRKKAEKKIEESEKRLKTFFRSGPDAVIVINQHQQILEWNPKAEIIFGYTEKEVVGKPLSETIIPTQYREAHKKGMTHFLKTGEGPVLNKTIEITALHKKGHEFYINLSISNVKIDGEWLFIAFLSDISERKKTEEALIRKEAELLQAKLLEEKKDEFISIASHELKTPLTTIKAYAQLALTLSQNEEQKPIQQYLSKIDQYAGKLNFLLNELLDVSRIHAGKLRLTQAEIEMNSFLPEVLTSMQQITIHHKIVLEKNESAKVKIDALRLEQVITNIISNAAKYSPGKEKIIVNSVKKDNTIVVSFTDFGIGIPKEKISKIFDRFYRVDEVSKDFSGLGIGLFISSEIIKQHSGKIWAESNELEGTTFYFSLPVIA
ncbi:MAG: PAS domain S-box protein [Bacteroidota bacterium]|nr:PAS domain S-box protein [Bacteroidota bacterium]